MEILQSRTLIKKVVEELDLYISYATKSSFHDIELYKSSPVKVWITPEEAQKLPAPARLHLTLQPGNKLNVKLRIGEEEIELYKSSPVKVWITPEEAQKLPAPARLHLTLQPGNKLNVKLRIGEEEYNKQFDKLPALLTTPSGTFSFTPKDSTTVQSTQEIMATVSSPRSVANAYRGALNIEPTSKSTTIAQISVKSTHTQRGMDFINKLVEVYNRDANDDKNEVATIEPTSKSTTIAQISVKSTHTQRGMDFINKLVEVYNRDANDDKNEVATKTAEFIDERIKIINGELGTTEQELETFKRDAGLTDLKSDAQLALSENSEYEKKRAENSTQLRLVQFLAGYANNPDHAYEVLPVNVDAQLALSENSEYEKKRAENSTQLRLVQFLAGYANNPDHAYEVLPVNVGLTDTGLAELINRYNEMLLERKRLLRSSQENNPVVVNLDASIRAMRSNVLTTINSVQRGLAITQADLERQAGKYAGRITNAPGQERQLVSISRQQEIKAGLYLMLLQKREENAITLASTANNARMVDEALADAIPVSPKGKMIYLVALILGIALPVVVIYIIELLKYKIEGRADVEKITSLPIVGDVPLSEDKGKEESIVVHENQNDLMAETFRNVRTNVLYMMRSDEKVILVTSTTTGEGKTFIASNLAVSLALLGKKIVIVGLDIRKPSLNKA